MPPSPPAPVVELAPGDPAPPLPPPVSSLPHPAASAIETTNDATKGAATAIGMGAFTAGERTSNGRRTTARYPNSG